MKEIFIFPRGQLTDRDRKAIERGGAIAVEADDPSKVETAIPILQRSYSDVLFLALIEACGQHASTVGATFTSALNRRLQDKVRGAVKESRPGVNQKPKVGDRHGY